MLCHSLSFLPLMRLDLSSMQSNPMRWRRGSRENLFFFISYVFIVFLLDFDLPMAIEAQFYGSNNLMVFFNSQQYKHNLQQSGQQQWLHQARQMTQNTSLVDPVFSSFSNSNAQMNAFHKYNHNAQPLASYPHQSFATQLDEQREIDHYIRSQVSFVY